MNDAAGLTLQELEAETFRRLREFIANGHIGPLHGPGRDELAELHQHKETA